MEINKQPIYPVEPWTVTETEFKMETNYRNETTFSLSNGYLGTRGTLEEGYPFTADEGLEGNFINGFYESEPIRYGEWNYGFPTESQSLLNLPNLKTIRIFLEGEELDIRTGKVSGWRRTLHMDRGTVTRSFDWTSPSGRTVHVETARLVSFEVKNLMAMSCEVTPVNFDGEITFLSVLDADVENHTRKTNPLVDYGPFGRCLITDVISADETMLFYQGTTEHSGITMACGSVMTVKAGQDGAPDRVTEEGSAPQEWWITEDGLHCCHKLVVQGRKGRKITAEKQMAYTSSLDLEKSGMKELILSILNAAAEKGLKRTAAGQEACMKAMWKQADVVIEGDEALQQGMRFNLFHILQSASRDGKNGMGAKGLSGEGYEGHYFWDTEMYVIPVLIYTNASLAKSLLGYRFRTLNEARARARVLGHEKGALYPWRTINGREASTYFPLGTAQYHINADIAYAFKLYLDVTGDMEFLKDQAAEVLVETARVWADVGCFAEARGGKYCICAVTGPDEYNAIVDNNFYTNLMARENIRDAGWALDTLREMDEPAYEALAAKLGLKEEERELWNRIVENMYFPYDEDRKVYPLDDGFMIRKPWDESKIPPEKRHLLYENYHPLFIFRQRMSKQADAILGMVLHSNYFTEEELRRNYDFYQEVTLHHSSLSTCIFGILACQIGYGEEAYAYFSQSARMDLDDYHDNFYAGIHAANMAGTWQAVVFGFAGLRVNRGVLELHPILPEKMKGYEFRFLYRGSLLHVQTGREGTRVTLLSGNRVELWLGDTCHQLDKEGEYVCS